jgi:lysophospholipase L1-like esterase
MMVASRPRLTTRLALIPLGVVLAVCVLEAGLQAGAFCVRAAGQRLPATWLTGGRRILCLGDSNTYGIYLPDRTLAYPQQFERLWNASVETPRIEVLNLGYPGTNSSGLRRDLPRMLETFRPDVVIIMVGANDYWTAAVPLAAGTNLPDRMVQVIRQYSRVYQLVYMLRRALDHRQLEVVYPMLVDHGSSGKARYGDVEFDLGWTRAPRQVDHDQRLEENLRALVEDARAFGAEAVFMTYPSRMANYGDASRFLRSVADGTGARLIDLGAVFEPECPKEPCPDWLFTDHHPTARGYYLMAETLVRELQDER